MQQDVKNWHALDADAVSNALRCNEHGLSTEEVLHRRSEYGFNRMPPPKKRTLRERFFEQFRNVLIYVLLAASVITAILEHYIDAGVIFAVVLVNAVIGVVQEGKAEKALDAIRNMLSSKATVRRDGALTLIAAEELVPGDIVILQSGDKVPADIRLTAVKALRIDESILTGESMSVAKQRENVDEDAVVAERKSMAHSGTMVTFGTGSGIVVATGESTQVGRISVMLSEVKSMQTPLLKQIAQFARWLTGGILAIASATFLFGLLVQGFTAVEMFMAAVGLAVAAIPEGLPAIMTITLAIGVQKMAGRRAIIRRLPAVETLGSVTVICSDKTGTLTKNEMTVRSVATVDGMYDVSGAGYDPHGFFTREGSEIDPDEEEELVLLCRTAMLCNDASVHQGQNGWHIQGDPTEAALVVMGKKAGLDPDLEIERFPRVDVIPFESEHGYMVTLHHDHAGHGIVMVKGSDVRRSVGSAGNSTAGYTGMDAAY